MGLQESTPDPNGVRTLDQRRTQMRTAAGIPQPVRRYSGSGSSRTGSDLDSCSVKIARGSSGAARIDVRPQRGAYPRSTWDTNADCRSIPQPVRRYSGSRSSRTGSDFDSCSARNAGGLRGAASNNVRPQRGAYPRSTSDTNADCRRHSAAGPTLQRISIVENGVRPRFLQR